MDSINSGCYRPISFSPLPDMEALPDQLEDFFPVLSMQFQWLFLTEDLPH